MVVIQKMELESFERCTVKGQGVEVTSNSKRNSNSMSNMKKKKKQQHSKSGLTLEERPNGAVEDLGDNQNLAGHSPE